MLILQGKKYGLEKEERAINLSRCSNSVAVKHKNVEKYVEDEILEKS